MFMHIAFIVAVVVAIINNIKFSIALTLEIKKMKRARKLIKKLAKHTPGVHANDITLGYKDIQLKITIN